MKYKIGVLVYLVITYLAYGWKGLFWGIPIGLFIVWGFWKAANENKESVIKIIKEKIKSKE